MKKTGKVFVTDAQMRNSLGIIRSLGSKGLNVTAGEETRFATGFFSKYCKQHRVYPNPYKRSDAFASYMLEEVKENKYDVLFPVTDATVIPIVKRKEEFSQHTVIPYPNYDVLSKAMDKITTLKIALENSIPCPKTYYMGRYEGKGFGDLAGKMEYPVIIKPSRGYGSKGVLLCESMQDLYEKCRIIDEKYGSFIIQEYIPSGGELGVYTLFDAKSKPVALTVQKRIRSYPAKGGPSTLRETIKDEKTVEIAFRLLAAMKWTGLAMVEFRIDKRDGIPKLMEVNPRFWGSLQLSMLAGADFPYILYKMALGEDITPDLSYKEGIKCRWLLPGDILWFLTAPGKFKNLPSFFSFNTPDDIISLSDPGPTFGFGAAVARYLFDKDMWDFILKKT
jgi:predicted ATP-grasp superfamily ATP-dependent carboligase